MSAVNLKVSYRDSTYHLRLETTGGLSFGMGARAGYPNLQIWYNDGACTCTWIDLGSNFPVSAILEVRVEELGEAMKFDPVPVLRFLAKHQGEHATHGDNTSKPTVQDVMPGVSDEAQRKVMIGLLEEGLVFGCPCGCRGDWEITDKGLERIGEERTAEPTSW